MSWRASEVLLTLNRSIVLTRGVFELNSNPVPCCKLSSAYETDCCRATALDLDDLPDSKVGYYPHCSNQRFAQRRH